MSHSLEHYEFEEQQSPSGLEFLFISQGERDVIKIIRYSQTKPFKGSGTYNLGFGDYNLGSDSVTDDLVSNNGDAYRVFATVLETVPVFFAHQPDKLLVVRASDGRDEFEELCRFTCTKHCLEECRNFARRMRIYQAYVNRNYQQLSETYRFFGGYLSEDGVDIFEPYQNHKTYTAVFLCLKNNTFTI